MSLPQRLSNLKVRQRVSRVITAPTPEAGQDLDISLFRTIIYQWIFVEAMLESYHWS